MIQTNSTYWLAALGLAAIFFGTGCDFYKDLRGVPFYTQSSQDVGPDADVELDVISDAADADASPPPLDVEPDIEDEPDVPEDISDVPPDIADVPDVDPPPECPFYFGNYQANCNLVQNTGCGQAGHCTVVPGGDGVVAECFGLSGTGVRLENEVCVPGGDGGERCEAGLLCLGWNNPDGRGHRCAKYCFMSTGEGCSSDQFCTFYFNSLSEVGFCVDRCDPYDSQACPTGQVCAPDSNYAIEWTCFPEFRCLRNGAPDTEVEYKSSCEIARLHTTGCPVGQTCIPTDDGERCVLPCQDDEDCVVLGAEYSCSEAQSDFELRYCD
ncbi:MAG: hypothetical protein ACNA8W_03990 [Bradymonadaceae bacterium]